MLRVVQAATIAMGAKFVGAQSSMEEMHETAQLFKLRVSDPALNGLEIGKKQYQKSRFEYYQGIESSESMQTLQEDYNELIKTEEFKSLSRDIQDIKNNDLTVAQKQEITQFENKYNAQVVKTVEAFKQVQKDTGTEIEGLKEKKEAWRKHKDPLLEEPLPADYYVVKPNVTIYHVDNDQWIAANREYFKLKKIAFDVFQLDVVRQLQWKMRSLRDSKQATKLLYDWKDFTHNKEYQMQMSEEANLALQFINLIQVDEKDRMLTDPKCSPPIYDAFHMIFIYFKAVAEGEPGPLLDFISNGKFHDDFAKVIDFDEKCYDKFEEDRRKHIDAEARKAIQEQIDQELEKKRIADDIKWQVERRVKDAFDQIIKPQREKIEKEKADKKQATKNAEQAINDVIKKLNPGGSAILLI